MNPVRLFAAVLADGNGSAGIHPERTIHEKQTGIMQQLLIRFAAKAGLLVFSLETNGAADTCDPARTFADGKTPLREIFVSPSGNNSTGNGSQVNLCQTISRAVQSFQPGDAVLMLPDTHSGGTSIGNLNGTSNAPTWLGRVPSQARPTISGGMTAIQLAWG